jgi:hypothetical protein
MFERQFRLIRNRQLPPEINNICVKLRVCKTINTIYYSLYDIAPLRFIDLISNWCLFTLWQS